MLDSLIRMERKLQQAEQLITKDRPLQWPDVQELSERFPLPTNGKYDAIALSTARYIVYYGGRGSRKTWEFGKEFVLRFLERPGYRLLLARHVAKSSLASQKLVIKDWTHRMGVSHLFDFPDRGGFRCKNGGLAEVIHLKEHTSESLKGYEGFDDCWVEEARDVPKTPFEDLTPTLRGDRSQIFVSYNPKYKADYVHDRFVLKGDKLAHVEFVTWQDNPDFPKVLKLELESDLDRLSQSEFAWKWGGKTLQYTDGAMWPDFDSDNEIDRADLPEFDLVLLGHDPGDINPALSVIGRSGRKFYLLYSKRLGNGVTAVARSDVAKAANTLCDRFDVNNCYIPPENYQALCQLWGSVDDNGDRLFDHPAMRRVFAANNALSAGCGTMGDLIKSKRFLVCSDLAHVPELVYSYQRDKNKLDEWTDKPAPNQDDHEADSWRYGVATVVLGQKAK